MRKIKSKNTSPELLFKSLLKKAKIRFTTCNKRLPGNPDFVLKYFQVAIFIDGEFWHGYKWNGKKRKIKSNRSYWIQKIEGNIRRDRKNNLLLKKLGWRIVRFWEGQIKKNPDKCINRIKRLVEVNYS